MVEILKRVPIQAEVTPYCPPSPWEKEMMEQRDRHVTESVLPQDITGKVAISVIELIRTKGYLG